MPTYTYECPVCKEAQDHFHSISTRLDVICPHCPGVACNKIISAAPSVRIDAQHEAVPTTRKR